MPHSIAQLNQMDESAFVAALGEIFEDTPEIARRTWLYTPFVDINALHQRMVSIVHDFSLEEKLILIRAHPDLGMRAKMATASLQEQAGVGLDRLSPEAFERLQTLNQAYRQKFAFPFIIAVKDQTLDTILSAFDRRLNHDITAEIHQAITEITKIARFRLEDSVAKP
jgi:2-oxo-4-hydroxy-4-carboxy-5-ureidoimidazoline decarboxylase